MFRDGYEMHVRCNILKYFRVFSVLIVNFKLMCAIRDTIKLNKKIILSNENTDNVRILFILLNLTFDRIFTLLKIKGPFWTD